MTLDEILEMARQLGNSIAYMDQQGVAPDHPCRPGQREIEFAKLIASTLAASEPCAAQIVAHDGLVWWDDNDSIIAEEAIAYGALLIRKAYEAMEQRKAMER